MWRGALRQRLRAGGPSSPRNTAAPFSASEACAIATVDRRFTRRFMNAAHRSAARRVEVLSTMRSMPKTRTIGALCCVRAVAAAAESSSLVGRVVGMRAIVGVVVHI